MIAEICFLSKGEIGTGFYYKIPLNLDIKIGDWVWANFANSKELGLVLDIQEDRKFDFDLKDIIEKNKKIPSLFLYQTRLIKFISSYYFTNISKSLKLFTPKLLINDNWTKNLIKDYILYKKNNNKTKSQKLNDYLDKINDNTSFFYIKKKYGISLQDIKYLCKKGYIDMSEIVVIPPYFLKNFDYKINDIKKIDMENININKKNLLCEKDMYKKINFFINIAYKNFKNKKQTLILLPEIFITIDMIKSFYDVFSTNISVLHSKLSESEKLTEFYRIYNNESYVIIGTRTALFYPFSNLQTIVMDQEHEWTYKSQKSPRYNTIKIVEKMSEFLDCEILLSSITPSIDTLYKVEQKEYKILGN